MSTNCFDTITTYYIEIAFQDTDNFLLSDTFRKLAIKFGYTWTGSSLDISNLERSLDFEGESYEQGVNFIKQLIESKGVRFFSELRLMRYHDGNFQDLITIDDNGNLKHVLGK